MVKIEFIYKIFFISILSIFLCGCNPFVAKTPMDAEFKLAPIIRPFYDEKWLLMEDLTFTAKRKRDGKIFEITVPAGFVNDLASIPIGVNLIFNKTGRYSSAGILHDYLYWTQACDRDTSDRLIKEALKATGSWYGTRNTIKIGVMLFGWWAWNNNIDLRKNKEERYIPFDARDFGSHVEWKNYKNGIKVEPPWGWFNSELKKEGQADYCHIFDDED